MSRSFVEKSAYQCAEAVVFVSRAVVKLVDAEENIIELSGINTVERIKKRGMGADKFCCGRMVEKFADDGFFEFSLPAAKQRFQ